MPDIPIPRKIAQTWETYDVPEKWSECIPSIKKHMSNWEHKLYSAEDRRDLIRRYFPDFMKKFDYYSYPVQRADAWRYLYLYLYGGIYIDLDYVVRKPFDSLFEGLPEADIYCVYSGNIGKYITNSFIACKPKCKIFLEIYEEMLKKERPWWAIGRHLDIMNTTGPIMFNRIVKKYRKDKSLGVKVEFIPRERFYVCSACNPYCLEETSFVKGLPGQSWASWDTAFYNSFRCNWPFWVTILILAVVIIGLFILYLIK